MITNSNDLILFDEIAGKNGKLGTILLNRPQALNSLNLVMIESLHRQLQTWAHDTSIKAIIIRAVAGRAFCAGGDLRYIYEMQKIDPALVANYFFHEYQLNRLIFHYPKPYLAYLEGITMGGGAGISIHGSHRLASNQLKFAMPETGIGFFPDVGGTYFLPRLNGQIGYYLALTGTTINAIEAKALGIIHTIYAANTFTNLMQALTEKSFDSDAKLAVTHMIKQFDTTTSETSNLLMKHRHEIDECFSFTTMEEIMQALAQNGSEFCQQTANILRKKSPLSLKVTLRALRAGAQLDFDACMRQEYRLTCRFIEKHDFLEGIRALIIDKDQQPTWQFSSLTEVTSNAVDEYFLPLAKELF